jgi:hypothetical protein
MKRSEIRERTKSLVAVPDCASPIPATDRSGRKREEEKTLSAVAGEEFDSVDLNTSRANRAARTGEVYASKFFTSPHRGEVDWRVQRASRVRGD